VPISTNFGPPSSTPISEGITLSVGHEITSFAPAWCNSSKLLEVSSESEGAATGLQLHNDEKDNYQDTEETETCTSTEKVGDHFDESNELTIDDTDKLNLKERVVVHHSPILSEESEGRASLVTTPVTIDDYKKENKHFREVNNEQELVFVDHQHFLDGLRQSIIEAERTINAQVQNIEVLEFQKENNLLEIRDIELSRTKKHWLTNQLREQLQYLQELWTLPSDSVQSATHTLQTVQENLTVKTQQLLSVKVKLAQSVRELTAEQNAHRAIRF